MDEKTEELRDIFTSVTDGEDTVLESQEDTRGSLEADDSSIEERLLELVGQMRDRYEFDLGLDDDDLATLAELHYDDNDDPAIADELDVDEATVFEARMALHLVTPADRDEPVLEAIRDGSEEDLDVDEGSLERQHLVAAADERSLTANHRYRDEFDALLADADISQRMASDLREDGLEDATEGMETDVSF